MRILKFLAAAFVAVLAAGSLQARRTDSDVQTKAREALQQAEADQDAQAGAAKNATPPPAKRYARSLPMRFGPRILRSQRNEHY